MSVENQSNLTVEEAQIILSKFNCIHIAPAVTESEKAIIRNALLLLVSLSDYQILGICADTFEQGLLALEKYSQALGYEADSNLAAINGAVYIKFNGKNGLSYINSYTGNHRGVLVSCQSYYEGGINAMYGHLPLDLFE